MILELFTLIRRLADRDPWTYSPDGDRCFWCDVPGPRWPSRTALRHPHTPDAGHSRSCPWVEAQEMLKEKR